jgi:hypothetical protein
MGFQYNPAGWSSFFSAQVSASAALAGLIFVAVSINLDKVIAGQQLIARSAQALSTLTGVLLASTCCLVPGQPVVVLGSELVGLALAIWLASTFLQYRASYKNPYVSRSQKILLTLLTQTATLPFIAAGVSLLMLRGGGLYWMLPGAVFSFMVALLDAWVLLIEIQR